MQLMRRVVAPVARRATAPLRGVAQTPLRRTLHLCSATDSRKESDGSAAGVQPAHSLASLQTTLNGLQRGAFRKGFEVEPLARDRPVAGFASGSEDGAAIYAPGARVPYQPGPVIGRFAVLAEVLISKIFPAGFGWQGFSCIAEEMGCEADQVSFFFITGVGDFCGVLAGHTTFYFIKKCLFDPSIKMSDTFQVGVWLASAAFLSGGAWQPIVNAFQAKGTYYDGIIPFNNAVAGTTLVCGCMFYLGCASPRPPPPLRRHACSSRASAGPKPRPSSATRQKSDAVGSVRSECLS